MATGEMFHLYCFLCDGILGGKDKKLITICIDGGGVRGIIPATILKFSKLSSSQWPSWMPSVGDALDWIQAKLDDSKDALLSDVCIATLAPYYFPPHYFKTKSSKGNTEDFHLVDGGVAANNPVNPSTL
ncbi:hypothetical protein FEM48_Zijuj07G0155400 [Ziziphus jujuba var. spinosa]|uniref:Patatin n=1 Tax=Ziziphus jujuba var. spinosa TaxID=714518 RepID=A0A978V5G3_ZIZJJ|nr:hypothetical protein FEM48_Zijuj07G0155400 [Ziziphus jujuba var. spinosa]